MKQLLLLTFFVSCVTFLSAQKHPAYTLFNAQGKKVTYKKMLKALESSDIVLFGEFHNNPIAHWLQLEVVQQLEQKRKLTLGAEMFEADNQTPLNQYLTKAIDAKGLDTLARLWPNFKTDYKPVVDFAKEKNIPFIATNIPRRYASTVYKKGLEALEKLPADEKNWIAPLPIAYDPELPGYKQMLNMVRGHSNDNFPKAQAIKDATMAHFILKNYQKGSLFLHLNGAYHSDNYEGILWYLKQQQPTFNYQTITTVSQKDLKQLLKDNKGKADFIICVRENMTTTY